ncbi:MAG: hypothetical protein NT080_10195 [Spirochaetes bacterium]|nr:hypothetical protein [Spirochaetota bacterium]
MKRYLALPFLLVVFAGFSDDLRTWSGEYRIKKVTVTDSGGTAWSIDAFTWDAQGRPTSRSSSWGADAAPSSTTAFEYAADGSRATETTKDAQGKVRDVVTHHFSGGLRRRTELSDVSGEVLETTLYWHDAKGRETAVSVVSGPTTGMNEVPWVSLELVDLDAKGQPLAAKFFYQGFMESRTEYQYAAVSGGSSVTAKSYDPVTGKLILTTTWQYDAQNRLVKKSQGTPDNERCVTYVATYAYDAAGNLASVRVLNHAGDHSFTLTFEWEKGKSDRRTLENLLRDLVRMGC